MKKFCLLLFFFGFTLPGFLMAQEYEVLRTPEERFKDLENYPFTSHYVAIGQGLRMHYLDEGDPQHLVILLLHGEPSWSFLYRNIILFLVEQGYRVIAPDLIGFGKSDKIIDKKVYTYHNHTTWLSSFIESLELKSLHLYCHDWGGMIALRIVAAKPELFSSVIASYAFLFTGEEDIPQSFLDWQHFSQTDSAFLAGNIVNWGCYTELPNDILAAYNAPFPDETYKAAARVFLMMIPFHEEDPEAKINAQLREKLKTFDKPFLTIWGDNNDEMWHGKDKILQAEIPGAKGQHHRELHANHFLQEDQSEIIASIIIEFLAEL